MANRDTVLWGRYRLLDVLGDGGMARVFQAEDERLARRVAVKVLHEHYLGQPEFVRRFEQEAQLAAGLTHPNIVAIYDMGRDGDTYFIVMEYVDGGSLKGIIAREAPLPLNRAIAIMRQLGSALDYAHQHGVVHRDIKPENILLSAGHHVKVSDFGIARALTTPGQTATGIVLGSVSYFSPEQAQGQPATAQSDLYSSGVVLYEMLTKRLPFTADTTLSVAMKHITQQPVPPRTYVPQLPQAVDTVVLKALSKHPIDRYVSGNALAEALAAAAASAGRPGTAMPVARAAQMRAAQARTVRVAPVHTPPRRRAPAVALLMLALFGGAGMFAYAHGNDIKSLLGQRSPNAGPALPAARSATPTATTTATRAPATTPASTATAPASAVTTPAGAARTPAATATAPSLIAVQPTATPTVPSPTGTPTASHTPVTPSQTPSETRTPVPTDTATKTPQPADHKQLSAEIVTASSYAFGDGGVPVAVNPSDAFSLDAGHAYAIIHINNLPKKASVGARWTFPNGHSFDIKVAGHFSSYWIVGSFADAGRYTVSALVNGKPVGSHDFEVTPAKPAKAKKPKKSKESPDTLPIAPAGELAWAVRPTGAAFYPLFLAKAAPEVGARAGRQALVRVLTSRPTGGLD